MEISSLCPFCVSTLVWEAQPSQFSLTVTVKATFSLVDGAEAQIAEMQEPIAADRHWDDRPMASLFAPADVVPSKRKVDVLLVGHARAPGDAPATSLVARLVLGDVIDKSVQVTGDRVWAAGEDGVLRASAPAPFATMPLRFERGPLSSDNPVGIDAAGPAIHGAAAAPNLEPLDGAEMGGFGPVVSTWRGRRTRVDDAGLFWAYGVASDAPARTGPPPANFDFSFFNAAPLEQQIELVRPGMKVAISGMSRTAPTIDSAVPAIRPQVFRIAPGGRAEEITLRCDTVWIDADRGLLVLTFRGVGDAGDGDESGLGSLVVVADPGGKRLKWDRVQKLLEGDVDPASAPAPAPTQSESPGRDPLAMRYDAVLDEATRGKVPEPGVEPPRSGGERPRSSIPPRPSTPAKTTPPPPMAPRPISRPPPVSRPQAPSRPPPISRPPPVSRPPAPSRPPMSSPPSIPVAAPLAPPLVAMTPRLAAPLGALPPSNDEELAPEKTQPLVISALPVPAMIDEETTSGPTEPRGDAAPPPSNTEPRQPAGESLSDLDEPTRAKRTDTRLPALPGARITAIEPADVGLFAAVSAHLARKGIERGAVLEAHGMSDTEFASLAERWRTSLESETDRGKKDLASAFDMAYVAAQERLDPPIGIAEYAQIVVALERGDVGRVLAELDLELGDLMRLQRVWARRVTNSPEAKNSLDAAIAVMRRE